MKPTLQQPLPSKPFANADELLQWMNYQGLEFLRQVQQAGNRQSRSSVTASTAGTGLATTVWQSANMPTGSAWSVDARVTVRATNNSGVDGRVDISGLFSRQASGATQTGATTTLVSIGPHAATLVASGSGVLVRVQDDGVHAVDWAVDITLREVT